MKNRKEIIALDKALIWHPYTPMKKYIEEVDPIVVERAEGIYLFDVDGTKYIDGNASWWVNILGHNHPRLMQALRDQTETLAHCAMAGITHEKAALLAEKLLPMCGDSYSRIFFSDDGSTAVEVAVRMAYQYWQIVGRPGKNRFVTLNGAFHGETLGAASVSGSKIFHKALEPLLFDRILLPSPARTAVDDVDWAQDAFAKAEELLTQSADEIAAIIVEPLVQGAAGMLMYPPDYLRSLHELCKKLDILFIADEVFVGYGRTGSFLAHRQADFEADIVCLAKGFSGGVLPMAGTVVNDRVFQAFMGGPDATLWYGHSFTGNPLGCAVALETLKILEDDKIIVGLPTKFEAIRQGLETISQHPWVRDIRQTGIIAAFTLCAPGSGSEESDYLDDSGWRFFAAAKKRGALLRPMGNVVYFVLPLTITQIEIENLFAIVRESIDETFSS